MSLVQKASFLASLCFARALHRRIPLTVIFNITDHCNANCGYCYARYFQRNLPELGIQEINTILSELRTMGCKRISLGGGEPLLRKDLARIIEAIKKNGMECIINSNGILVPEKIEILRRVNALCISLDGPENVHDTYRGKGSFQKVLLAIETASAHRIPLHTNTVLHHNNINSIDFILTLAKKYGFFAEFNIAIAPLSETNKAAPYKASEEEIRTTMRKLIQYKKAGHNILFSKKAFELALAWPDYGKESLPSIPNTQYPACAAGSYFCFIDTDGGVYACPHLIGKVQPLKAQDGFRQAFEKLARPSCSACYQVYHNEFNLLFNLDIEVIANYGLNTILRLFRK